MCAPTHYDIIVFSELRKRESWGVIDKVQDSKTRPRNSCVFAIISTSREFSKQKVLLSEIPSLLVRYRSSLSPEDGATVADSPRLTLALMDSETDRDSLSKLDNR